jgi:hypothetical protein
MFVVNFNKGYYSKKQPNYDWSFTKDINEALQYKTELAARQRLADGQQLGYTGYVASIIQVITELEKLDATYTCAAINCDRAITETEYNQCNQRCAKHNKSFIRRQQSLAKWENEQK